MCVSWLSYREVERLMLVLQLDEMAAKPETKNKQDIGTFSDPACGNGTRQAEK